MCKKTFWVFAEMPKTQKYKVELDLYYVYFREIVLPIALTLLVF